MNGNYRINAALLLATVLLIAARGSIAWAQDDNVPIAEPIAFPRAMNAREANLLNLMRQYGLHGGHDVSLKYSERMLKKAIDDVAKVNGFSESQRLKIELAGRADIKHFLEQANQVTAKLRDAKNPTELQDLLDQLHSFELTLIFGPLGEGSLSKIVKRTLTVEQLTQYEKAMEARENNCHRVAIEAAVDVLKPLELREGQLPQFVRLMKEKTRPPRTLEPYFADVMLFQLSQLPEANLKLILDDNQWHKLTEILPRYEQMGPFLKECGYLPE